MVAYLVVFFITSFFTYIVQKELMKNRKNLLKIVLLLFSIIIIPSFVAGARKIGVGRDVGIYVVPVLKYAATRSFDEYMQIGFISMLEKGYTIFSYVFAQYSTNITLFLTLLQIIPCSCVLYFSYKKREEIPMWLVMLTYLLTWYCRSFTIMRQSIAVAFILVSIIKFEEKKYYETIIWYILALLFHSSAMFAIAIYFFIWINDNFKGKSKFGIFVIIFSLIIIMTLFYKNVLHFFTYTIQLLPEKFYNYTLNEDYYLTGLNISFADTLFRVLVLGLGLYLLGLKKYKSDLKHKTLLYWLLMLMELAIFIISFKMTNATRLGYVFFYPSVLFLFPSFVNIFKKDNKNRPLAVFFVITVLFIFWFNNYPIKKICETYPYRMQINKELWDV